ncbi:deleted in malignant brain tumors 1 protein-like [Haliotis rufescens]|uniref:deleted in malignant brain tumors 1 protein-like n=1 Tax=Haliotis rufescens TaxID=6454 RepID=UPI00201EB08A|nr:deleted in malignant brain tumors 1 protein-like [Haliotis rufescens]
MAKGMCFRLVCLAALLVNAVGQTIRLVSPLNNGVGRLEVYYNGSWGTVCDDDFVQGDAMVACRQLGQYEPGMTPTYIDEFGFGSGTIWLDDLDCTGNESSLSDCPHVGWGSSNCKHHEDVGIICDENEMTIKLTRYHQRGLLQVYNNGTWGTVCDDNFGQVEASVVCRRLGYQAGKVFVTSRTLPILLDDVQCTMLNTDLKDCKHGQWGSDNCSSSEAVGVECFSFTSGMCATLFSRVLAAIGPSVNYHSKTGNNVNCFSTVVPICSSSKSKFVAQLIKVMLYDIFVMLGISFVQAYSQIRLNSTIPGRGRVEEIHYNVWGTVCSGSSFSTQEAQVVCKMVNLPWTSANVTNSYGPGEGLVWLSNVNCTGTETSLDECSHSGWGTASCSHSSDVGVVCSGATLQIHLEPSGSVLNVILGQVISVVCVVDSLNSPVTSFRWTHNGSSYSGQTFSKTVTSKSDSGTLECSAGNMLASTQISVLYRPVIHLEPSNDTIDVIVGEDLHVDWG